MPRQALEKEKSDARFSVFSPVHPLILRDPGDPSESRTRRAQIREVVVGITMTCPYENAIEGSCWSGAYWALMKLEGIKSVEESANGYTCTARVFLKDKGIPDPDKWAAQFKALVDQTYGFRGVEVSLVATVVGEDSGLVLRIPGVERPVRLGPLEHKLQWNARKGTPRQPEPDETRRLWTTCVQGEGFQRRRTQGDGDRADEEI